MLALLGSDIALTPSRFEPFGLNVLEQLRTGCLVVGTRRGVMADVVRDARRDLRRANGWPYPDPQDSKALEQCIRHAFRLRRDNPDAWRGMVRNALHVDGTWDSVLPQYLRLYAPGPQGPPLKESSETARQPLLSEKKRSRLR